MAPKVTRNAGIIRRQKSPVKGMTAVNENGGVDNAGFVRKRPRDTYDTSPASSTPPVPPAKRARLNPSAVRAVTATTPFLPSSSSKRAFASSSRRSSTVLFSSPYPCPVAYPFSTPADSPSNPFRRRAPAAEGGLSLPSATSFAEHLHLRFALVRSFDQEADTDWEEEEQIYRVVQVPLNYNFHHLRFLVNFLFSSPPSKTSEPGASSRSKRSIKPSVPKHVFNIEKDIIFDPEQTGVIKGATTWMRVGCQEPDVQSDDTDGEGEILWEEEDDFRLEHVWPVGQDIKRGIIYHHNTSKHGRGHNLQIHITLNASALPSRKGVGNKPFIFESSGPVAPLPPPPPPPKIKPSTCGEARTTWAPQKGLKRWNAHGSFETFAAACPLTRPPIPPPAFAATPAASTSQLQDHAHPASDDSDASLDSDSEAAGVPVGALPATTPHPAQPALRARLARAERRWDRLSKRGMVRAFKREEEEEEEGEDVEEKDELDDSGEE